MQNDAKREWVRGWHLVLLTAIGLIFAPTTVAPYTIGLFVGPLHTSFGWSHGEIQGAILFSTGLGLAGGPIAGWLVRRIGLRLAILSGVAGIALALGSAAMVTGALWQFYLAYALVALLGAGTSAVTWSYLIADRFSASRGLALGIALSGTGLSAIFTPQLAAFGLDVGGWRMAYLTLAAVPLLIVLPACILLLPRNHGGDQAEVLPREGVKVSQALRSRHFWLMGGSTAAIYLAVGGLIPNLVPALTAKGVDRADAVAIMGILGTAIVVGRIIVGAAIDRIWAPAVATAVLIPAAGACLLLSTNASLGAYAGAVALLGVATGMEFDMLGFLVARYFGLADYARIYGRLYTFVAGAAGGAPLAFGALYDHLHNYEAAFFISALLLVGGAAGLLALGRYPAAFAARD